MQSFWFLNTETGVILNLNSETAPQPPPDWDSSVSFSKCLTKNQVIWWFLKSDCFLANLKGQKIMWQTLTLK